MEKYTYTLTRDDVAHFIDFAEIVDEKDFICGRYETGKWWIEVYDGLLDNYENRLYVNAEELFNLKSYIDQFTFYDYVVITKTVGPIGNVSKATAWKGDIALSQPKDITDYGCW